MISPGMPHYAPGHLHTQILPDLAGSLEVEAACGSARQQAAVQEGQASSSQTAATQQLVLLGMFALRGTAAAGSHPRLLRHVCQRCGTAACQRRWTWSGGPPLAALCQCRPAPGQVSSILHTVGERALPRCWLLHACRMQACSALKICLMARAQKTHLQVI